MRRLPAAALALAVPLLAGWAVPALAGPPRPKPSVHYTLVDAPARQPPSRLVLLPPKVRMAEVSAGGVSEEVAAWSDEARANVTDAVLAHDALRGDVEVVPAPELNADEQAEVEAYTALYEVVAGNAFTFTHFGGPAWRHKANHFDYTLGEGLEFLRERTGAEAALLVSGGGHAATTGRQVTALFGALLGSGRRPYGSSLLAGVVDLRTGDLLWVDIAGSDGSLRAPDVVRRMVDGMLRDFPHVDAVPAKALR